MKHKEIFICLVLIAALVPSIVWGAIEMKFCNYFPIPARQSKIGEEFIKDIEARCKGQLKITYFPAGTLLTAPIWQKGAKGDFGYDTFSTGRNVREEARGDEIGKMAKSTG
jgi:TRAP-type C4-dicarboxylate transport system substrate-binding protein